MRLTDYLTDSRSHGQVNYVIHIHLPGPSALGFEFSPSLPSSDGITMHSIALRRY